MIKQFLGLTLLLICSLKCFAQFDANGLPVLLDGVDRKVHSVPVAEIKNPLDVYEDSLVYFVDSITLATTDEGKLAAAQYIIKLMRQVLKNTASFKHPFTKLRQRMGILEPKDKRFRIYNWDFMHVDGSVRHYGVVQLSNGKYCPLIDVSDKVVRNQEDTILTNKQWYGANYYNVLDERAPDGSYFLLGMNQSSTNSKRKVLESMRIIGDSTVSFGAPIFQSLTRKNTIAKRFIVEYNYNSVVGFNWDPAIGMIIFDHLESNIGDTKKRYTFIPDGSYDGLVWNGKYWQVKNNVLRVTELRDGQNPNTPAAGTAPQTPIRKELMPEGLRNR